jgi:hypothetical protein
VIFLAPKLWTATWDGKPDSTLYVRCEREVEFWGNAGAASFPFTFQVIEYCRVERIAPWVYASRSGWFTRGEQAQRWVFSECPKERKENG